MGMRTAVGMVGMVGMVVLVVGVAVGSGGPSRAGAAGLRSNALIPSRYVVAAVLPCDHYGLAGAGGLQGIDETGKRMNRWVDRIPIAREDGREIVFADGNALYAAAVQGTQLWRLVREDTAFYMRTSIMRTSDAGRFLQPLRWLLRRLGVSTANVDVRRSRYGLEGIVSFDVSRVDGALAYATCWSYQPDGGDPEIAACRGPFQDQAQVQLLRQELIAPGSAPGLSGRRRAVLHWRRTL